MASPFNNLAQKLSPEQREALKSMGLEAPDPYEVAARNIDRGPAAPKGAPGKKLTARTEALSTPGTTSARSVKSRNTNKDGFSQYVTKYQADKTAQRSLVTYTDEGAIRITPTEEVRDRLMNQGNKHYTHNPLILRNKVVR